MADLANSKKNQKAQEMQQGNTGNPVLNRERSFVRTNNSQNQQNANKRRSLAFNNQSNNQQQHHHQNQLRSGKPAMEIYRPPKLNYKLQHSSSSSIIFPTPGNLIQHSKSSASLQQMHHQLAVAAAAASRYPGNHNLHHHHQQGFVGGGGGGGNNNNGGNTHQTILVQHPIHQMQLPILNASSGNIVHGHHRVKFAADPPQVTKIVPNNNNNGNYMNQMYQPQTILSNGYQIIAPNTLQRSKSMSSADMLARGMSSLNCGFGNESNDIGQFSKEIQDLIDKATADPNQLNSRYLIELATHVMQRAVEGRRYALPIARLCIAIIAKEIKETFLEAMLNTCRQWYQEREKILYVIQGMKSLSRTRFTAFMSFLTEMFCQLKRRQLQLRTQCDGAPPPLVLLTLLLKCCEDCVKPPVRSLSEIECLFFVLTCIGRDLEIHLPNQLEGLLSGVRDAFLNSNASAPAIRKTLLQLIELQASHWQLPGNTVLYYYPSTK